MVRLRRSNHPSDPRRFYAAFLFAVVGSSLARFHTRVGGEDRRQADSRGECYYGRGSDEAEVSERGEMRGGGREVGRRGLVGSEAREERCAAGAKGEVLDLLASCLISPLQECRARANRICTHANTAPSA